MAWRVTLWTSKPYGCENGTPPLRSVTRRVHRSKRDSTDWSPESNIGFRWRAGWFWPRGFWGQQKIDVSENRGTPKSSNLMRFSIINHPFWGTPIFGNPLNVTKTMSNFFGRPFLFAEAFEHNFFFLDILASCHFFPQNPWKSPMVSGLKNLHVSHYWLFCNSSWDPVISWWKFPEFPQKFNHTHKHTPFLWTPSFPAVSTSISAKRRNMQETHTNHNKTSWWLNQPIWKNIRQIVNLFPRVRDGNKKKSVATT